jgi:hypothetical protein
MKRRWNFSLWGGFLLVLAGLFSYVPLWVRFPVTRDFPWVDLLLFLVGGGLLAMGLARSFRQPQLYRGKIVGCLLAALSVAGVSLFVYGVFYQAKQLPPPQTTPAIGEKAPDFTLPDQNGNPVALAGLLAPSPRDSMPIRVNAVLLVFYRGHW